MREVKQALCQQVLAQKSEFATMQATNKQLQDKLTNATTNVALAPTISTRPPPINKYPPKKQSTIPQFTNTTTTPSASNQTQAPLATISNTSTTPSPSNPTTTQQSLNSPYPTPAPTSTAASSTGTSSSTNAPSASVLTASAPVPMAPSPNAPVPPSITPILPLPLPTNTTFLPTKIYNHSTLHTQWECHSIQPHKVFHRQIPAYLLLHNKLHNNIHIQPYPTIRSICSS
mmetsp:Transcript_22615/g.31908  ORF Transcript_22615/g.31908 Transcript_22615/m.31908 type:complete len:230 (-) Transcript_22615:1134-1823(-)